MTHSFSKTSRSVIRFVGSFSSMRFTRFNAFELMELHSSEGKSIVPFLLNENVDGWMDTK